MLSPIEIPLTISPSWFLGSHSLGIYTALDERFIITSVYSTRYVRLLIQVRTCREHVTSISELGACQGPLNSVIPLLLTKGLPRRRVAGMHRCFNMAKIVRELLALFETWDQLHKRADLGLSPHLRM